MTSQNDNVDGSGTEVIGEEYKNTLPYFFFAL